MEAFQQMFAVLHEHVSGRVPLSDEEFRRCTAFFAPKKLRKNQYLLQEGEVCKYLAFVVEGCLRSYTIDEKGEEHIVEFGVEGWWITDMYSFLSGNTSRYFIDALEDSNLLLIEAGLYDTLCRTVFPFERYFRILLQNHYIATQRRILASISLTAEEQYLQLVNTHPTLVGRVAQRHLASFLGISPEALSRIRKRLTRKAYRGAKSPS